MSNLSNTATVVLSAILGAGGIGGVVALFRLRTDRDATTVDTVSKGLMVLERSLERLEHERDHYAAEFDRARARILELELELATRPPAPGGAPWPSTPMSPPSSSSPPTPPPASD
jgi:hypothetical protein